MAKRTIGDDIGAMFHRTNSFQSAYWMDGMSLVSIRYLDYGRDASHCIFECLIRTNTVFHYEVGATFLLAFMCLVCLD